MIERIKLFLEDAAIPIIGGIAGSFIGMGIGEKQRKVNSTILKSEDSIRKEQVKWNIHTYCVQEIKKQTEKA